MPSRTSSLMLKFVTHKVMLELLLRVTAERVCMEAPLCVWSLRGSVSTVIPSQEGWQAHPAAGILHQTSSTCSHSPCLHTSSCIHFQVSQLEVDFTLRCHFMFERFNYKIQAIKTISFQMFRHSKLSSLDQ